MKLLLVSWLAFSNASLNFYKFDQYWGGVSQLRSCQNSTEEILSVQETMSSEAFKQLISTFAVTPNTDQQRECMLNSQKHVVTSRMLQQCVPLMAPGVRSNGSATTDERRYASHGLLPYLVDGKRVALCKRGQPCKEFNKFLINGSLEALTYECGGGASFAKLMSHGYFWKTCAEAVAMQNSDTGRTDECYTVLKGPNSTTSIRGPMFGPIYYINMAFAYLLGGEDYVGQFPGCRVPCKNIDCKVDPFQYKVDLLV